MGRALILLALLVGCNDEGPDTRIVDSEDEEDTEGPVIGHTPITEPQRYQLEVLVDATAEDPSGMFNMQLHFQQETAVEWKTRGMDEVGDGFYQGRIPGGDVASGGMRYFLSGIDGAGNEACLPIDCEADAWRFAVTAL